MKIELIKRTKLEGTFHYVYVDSKLDNVFIQLEDAEKRIDFLIERSNIQPSEEILKSIEL